VTFVAAATRVLGAFSSLFGGGGKFTLEGSQSRGGHGYVPPSMRPKPPTAPPPKPPTPPKPPPPPPKPPPPPTPEPRPDPDTPPPAPQPIEVGTPLYVPQPPARPPLQTGEEVFGELLNKPRVPSKPMSELDVLLSRGPESDFERLMRGAVKGSKKFLFRPGMRPRLEATPGIARTASSVARAGVIPGPWILPEGYWKTVIRGPYAERFRKGSPRRARVGTQPQLKPELAVLTRGDRGPGRRFRRQPALLPRVPVAGTVVASPGRSPGPTGPFVITSPRPVFRPGTVSLPAPRARLVPAPQAYPLAFLAPLALLLASSRSSTLSTGLVQPIPQPQPQPAPTPLPGGTLPLPLPKPQPLPSPLTQPQPAPLGSTPSKGDCDCTGARKRKPKKQRTICYAGDYRERRSGLTKERKRKIPCQ